MLGKIYTNKKIFKSIQFIEVKPLDEYFRDNDTPTLLMGKKDILDFGFKISLLNREIDKNLYWTYSKIEKRNEHENDLNVFYKNIFSNLFKKIKYKSVCLYKLTFNECKTLLNIINDENVNKCVYIKNNHIYIYYDNKIIGISIDEINYAGVNLSKVINKITSAKNCEIITSDNFIKNEIKPFIANKNFIIPYLYTLSN